MTISDKRKKRLFEELKNKEERDAYVSSSVDVGVAFQIRALREQREWSQTQLADKAKMQQERISTLENPSHSPTLSTLKKLASAFNVGLIVRFSPISELVKYELNLHLKSLEVPSFDEEDYFKENPIDKVATDLLRDHYSQDASRQPGKQSDITPFPDQPKGVLYQMSSYRPKKLYGIEKESPISIETKMLEDKNEAAIG